LPLGGAELAARWAAVPDRRQKRAAGLRLARLHEADHPRPDDRRVTRRERAVATYLSPGVFIEEDSTGPKPIAGLPTSIAAVVGAAEHGPGLEPTRLTGWNDYLATFGGFLDEGTGYTPETVFGFLENGGTARRE